MKKAISRKLNKNIDETVPDIFHAAEADDVLEMVAAISIGQTFQDTTGDLLFTPIHIAAMAGSANFTRAAAQTGKLDPWVRDRNQRLAIDHAEAFGRSEIQKILFELMYHLNTNNAPSEANPPTPDG